MTKRYYWLKLKKDFFLDLDIKKLRSMAGGDTLTVIYLEMLLLSLENDGKLEYTGLEDDFESEIAFTLGENPDDVYSVVAFLKKRDLLIECGSDEYALTAHNIMVGSECDSAERVRGFRNRKKLLHCNSDVTACNTEKEPYQELYQELENTTTNHHNIVDPASIGGGDFPPEIIQYAKERARGANNPAAYEAAILRRLRDGGITSIKEVRADDEKHKHKEREYKPLFSGEDVI